MLVETRGGGWEHGCREMLGKRINKCGAADGGDQVLLREGAGSRGRLWFSDVVALMVWGITAKMDVNHRCLGDRMMNAHKTSSGYISR